MISTPYYFGLFQLLTFQKSKVWLRNMNFDWLRFNQFKQEWWNVPDSSLLKNWWWRLLAVPDDKCLWRSQIKVLLTWPTFYTGSNMCPKYVIKFVSIFLENQIEIDELIMCMYSWNSWLNFLVTFCESFWAVCPW